METSDPSFEVQAHKMPRSRPSTGDWLFKLFVGSAILILIVMVAVHMYQESQHHDNVIVQTTIQKGDILNGQTNMVEKLLEANAQQTSPPPTPPGSQPIDCDVAIIGAGPGGLTMAYRLAPIYGSRLCIFDDRDHVGGKVHSIRYTKSTATRPVWTPTHAEQLRGGDSIMRCMAQEVGTIMVARGSVGVFYNYQALGINATGFQCFGNEIPTGKADCLSGLAWEGRLAPNGYTGQPSPYGTDLPVVCGNKDWTQCSYTDEYSTLLRSPSNANSIIPTESFGEYATRILGVNGAKYFSDQNGLAYMDVLDARAMVDYLNYDATYAFGAVHMAHGAPQVGTWNRVAKLIVGNASRLMLNKRIQSIDKALDNTYTLYTSDAVPVKVTAKRVVIAFPPSYLKSMSGSVVESLIATPYVSYSQPTHACSWNAFFPSRWWKEFGSTCNFGYCATSKAFNLTGFARENYMSFNSGDSTGSPTSLDFVQYVPTPERKEGSLLRYFFEEASCREMDRIYTESGASGVQAELMYRTRFNFEKAVGKRIPDPVEAYYQSDLYAYAGIAPGAPFRALEWMAWAAEPIIGEKLCFATEGVNMLDSGWQEGAARVAHNCLKGNVFKDVISSTRVQALERCRANISTAANRYLDGGNKNSGNDVCLLLRNEYHLRDLANYTTCGSPKTYDYPTLASFTSTSYQPDQMLWKNAITTAVYEKPNGCRGRHC